MQDTGKSLLGQNFINRASRFLCKNDSFFDGSSLPGDNTIDFKISTKASKVNSSCTSELTSGNNSNSSSEKPSFSSSQRDSLDAAARLTEMKSQSPDKLILGHININSIRNRFDGVEFVIYNKIGTFLISETKLDDLFPTYGPVFNRTFWHFLQT